MSELIPKNKTIRFMITFTVLSALLYFVALFFVNYKTDELNDFYKSAEIESSRLEKFREIKELADKNSLLIKNLDEFFVKKDGEIGLIEQMESLAKKYNLKLEINSLDVKNDETSQFKEDMNMKIKFEGSWINTISFFNDLEKMPFGIVIQGVNLDKKEVAIWFGFAELLIFKEK